MRWLTTADRPVRIESYCRQWARRELAGELFEPLPSYLATVDGYDYGCASIREAAVVLRVSPEAVRLALRQGRTACGCGHVRVVVAP